MSSYIKLESVDYNPFSEDRIIKLAKVVDAQKEIWLSCIIGGKEANLSFNQSFSLIFKGLFDKDVFVEALNKLVRRHEGLRMTFSADGHHLMIYDFIKPNVSFHDFSELGKSEKDILVKSKLQDESTLVFDLQNGPLIRLNVIKLEADHFHVILCAHHLVVDGWSLGVILEELSAIYNAFLNNESPRLKEAIQYSQYSQDLTAFKESVDYDRIEQYWLEQYKSKIPQLELPIDVPRPTVRTFGSRRDDFLLPTELVRSVKDLSKNSRISLVSTLMAAFEIFLYKVSGQKEIVLGLPAAGQSATGNPILVGHCVNLLPLKAEINPDFSFLNYLNFRRSQVMDAYDHQNFTFGKLLEKLNVLRDPSRIPLVPVIFNIDMGMDIGVRFDGLEFNLLSNPRKFENFEIFLNLTGKNDDINVEWSYNKDLFSKDTIAHWMDRFEDILIQVTNDPNIKIKNIGVNYKNDLKRISEWNSTFLKLTVENSLIELFEKAANETPTAKGVLTNNQEVSYLQLDKMSLKIAHHLHQEGIKKGDIVAVLLDRTPNLVAALLGVMRSGAAYLPLDPLFPEDRISYMIKDSSAKVLLTESKYAGKFIGITDEHFIHDYLIEDESNTPNLELPDGNDLAYILYTSGSTGKPKGVKVTHLNLLNFLESMKNDLNVNPKDRLLAITTVSFDIAGLEIFLPLVSGASVVLADKEESRDGWHLLHMVETFGVTMIQATPATWRLLIGSGWKKNLNLKVLCGGEALSSDLAEMMLRIFGSFWNVYGPTETTIWSTIKKIENHQDISIGHPIANTQVYILDSDLAPVAIGSVGEICIGGLGVSKGYLNREDLTNDKFVPDPFPVNQGTDSKIYRTGDMGKFLPNGEIICLGRLDNQVKIRGYRIELGEIETSLNKIEGVKESVVIALEDSVGDKRLVGYIVPDLSFGIIPESEKIKAYRQQLKLELPDYMIPNDWCFLEKLPLTANNKVDRRQLPNPSKNRDNLSYDLFEAKNEYDEMAIEIWSKILNLKVIESDSDFFENGGHSILALEAMSLVEKKIGSRFPINTIFKYPKIKDFSDFLQNQNSIDWGCIVPIKPNGHKDPVYLIHGAGANITPFYSVAKYLDSDQPVFGIQAKGLNGIDEPLKTIEEMATFYIDTLVKQNPKGPYNLAGQSFGAYVAFEMAKQMKKRGLDVGKIILLDVSAYQSASKQEFLEKWIATIKYELNKRIIDISLLIKNPTSFTRMKSKSFLRKKRKIRKMLNFELQTEESNLFHTIQKIRRINHKAMDEYFLSPYEGKIFLFKAKIMTFLVKDKEYYDWLPYAKEIFPIEVEGDHNSMIEDPEHVKKFSEKLQTVLNDKYS